MSQMKVRLWSRLSACLGKILSLPSARHDDKNQPIDPALMPMDLAFDRSTL